MFIELSILFESSVPPDKTFEMEVRTFVSIKKVIWDQLLASKAETI